MPNIPLNVLGLSVPNMTFQNGNKIVTRPITDHPPIIQNTHWGAIGTINILNPGSPIAPPAQIDGVKALPANGQVQMELMAEYIFKMFQQGVGLLALQEVPEPQSANFRFLSDKLKSLAGTSNLIDVDTLTSQWLKTGTHSFGTSILCNPKQFRISSNASPGLNNRAAVCEVTTANGQVIPVANIHGDFTKQPDTANYVAGFDGFCLGDLNITHSAFAPAQDADILQSIERPTLQVEGNTCVTNTVDFIQDKYSKQFNSAFVPDVGRIAQLQNTEEGVFQPVVIKISSFTAVPLLKNFATYLARVQPELINSGRIIDVDLKTQSPYNIAHITIKNEVVYQAYKRFMADQFSVEKTKIQQQFITQLNVLDNKISAYAKKSSASYKKGQELHQTLYTAQETFFSSLTPDASFERIQENIANFRKVCEQNVRDADRIMGHGWLYRIGEVLLKAVAGLYAGIGMVLGIIGGQGLANPQHRQAYRDSFLTLNQSTGSKALQEFKQTILGEDEDEPGLLDEDKLTPKNM
ncbi:hypothetical protein [Legionella drancourtii]|uniref:Uncharacterized protein n=1 Tax=Legionella drancourtii LLAP12 TaxID=658187 RepID=G9ELU0_9GAMM|nr:hypothetical protein [Legionella drancourtii]EHL31748.1 hypothetical protein LDG_6200 [Legionella drancourtii LLAP12]